MCCKHAKENNKTVNKHDKINGSGKKRCTNDATISKRTKQNRSTSLCMFITIIRGRFVHNLLKIENSDIFKGIEICSRRVVPSST